MKRARLPWMAGAGLAVTLTLTVGATRVGAGAHIVVRPGQSIQSAIDAAVPGTTILVRAGTYAENLEIYKDGLILRGAGAGRTILVPPGHARQRYCTPDPDDPFVAGICAIGDVDFNTAQVSRFLRGVRVSGFSVRNFTGIGIVLVGVEDGMVAHNESTGNGARGILALNSTRTVITGNVIRHNDGAGIQIDKVEFVGPGSLPPAHATVVGNVVSGTTGPGILIFDADQGRISGNTSTGNCGGILLVNLSGTQRAWIVSYNLIAHNDLVCPPQGGPPLSGLGIEVTGTHDVRIEHNVVTHNRPAGDSLTSGGIAVDSSAPFGGADPHEVQVKHNVILGNEPSDITWDGTGTDIEFDQNVCASSVPLGLCSE